MWILFEDAPNTPVSRLISTVYDGTQVHVGFVGGAGNFYRYILSNQLLAERVLVYYDLIPDNPNTAKGFRLLSRRLREYSNVIIAPVICTEYALLKSLGVVVPELSDVLYSTYPTGVTSAEKYYKYYLDTHTRPC